MPKRGAGKQVHAIAVGVGHHRRKKPIAGSKLSGQLVIVRKVGLVVIAHGSCTRGINARRYRGRGLHESIHFPAVPIAVAFVPIRAQTFMTYRLEMVRMNRLTFSVIESRAQRKTIDSVGQTF